MVSSLCRMHECALCRRQAPPTTKRGSMASHGNPPSMVPAGKEKKLERRTNFLLSTTFAWSPPFSSSALRLLLFCGARFRLAVTDTRPSLPHVHNSPACGCGRLFGSRGLCCLRLPWPTGSPGPVLLWGACTALHPLAVCTHLSAHPSPRARPHPPWHWPSIPSPPSSGPGGQRSGPGGRLPKC